MIIDINNLIGHDPHGNLRTVGQLLSEMDAAGVDMACIACFPHADENDAVLLAAKQYPTRLIPLYSADPHDTDAAARFLSAVGQGMRGLRLHPLAHGYSVNDISLLTPLLAVCKSRRLPVWIYGTADVGTSPILFQDLAEAFPTVPIIIGYMGFNYEAASAISIAAQYDNLYLDPTAAMFQNLRRAIRNAGPKKILLGSGTPVSSYFPLEIAKMRDALTEPTDLDLVLYQNAARLFSVCEGEGAQT